MGTLTQTVLPFKVEATEELLTANAGLALFGEFTQGLGLHRWLTQEMPLPGSGRGYEAGAFVSPLVLMLAGGGRSLEDLRTLKNDTALAALLKQYALPSTDAAGDWLRRTGAGLGSWMSWRMSWRMAAPHGRGFGVGRPGSRQPTRRRHPARADRHHPAHPGLRCLPDRGREGSGPIHL